MTFYRAGIKMAVARSSQLVSVHDEDTDPEELECLRRIPDSRYAEFVSTKIRLWEELHAHDDEINEEERGENLEGWALLPDIILEKIFSYLSIEKKYYASITCRHWYNAFHLPRVWWNFEMTDTTLARHKYDHGNKCYLPVLEPHRTQQMLRTVGNRIRRLAIHPTSFPGLFSHFHFMTLISNYAERYINDPTGPNSCSFNVETFRFTFFCDIKTQKDENYVFGTGGDILQCIKRAVINLTTLRRLELIDLLLDTEEAQSLLDDACMTFCENIRHLTLINPSKHPTELLHPAAFINLRKLVMSPQNVGDELVSVLSGNPAFEELHLVQTSYSGTDSDQGAALFVFVMMPQVSPKIWMLAQFKVFLRTFSRNTHRDIKWQEKAPVASVIYDCPFTKPCPDSLQTVADMYPGLTEFGHYTIPKFRSSRKFSNRIDAPLLRFCKRLPYLTTLCVRDRISTSTALLIVSLCPNLKYFIVRRNALLKKRDFMFHDELHLDFNFTEWIKINCKCYEKTGREISKIMGISWRPLSDQEFKLYCQNHPAF